MKRPSTVDLAFWLLVAHGVLGLLTHLVRGMQGSAVVIAVAMVYTFGFAYLIRSGKNWARIVYAALFVLGNVGMAFTGGYLARLDAIYLAIFALQTALQCYALWLTFRLPGSLWFKPHHHVQSS